MRSIACRRMIQKEAPFVRSGASFETRRLRRRPQDEKAIGSYFLSSDQQDAAVEFEVDAVRRAIVHEKEDAVDNVLGCRQSAGRRSRSHGFDGRAGAFLNA